MIETNIQSFEILTNYHAKLEKNENEQNMEKITILCINVCLK